MGRIILEVSIWELPKRYFKKQGAIVFHLWEKILIIRMSCRFQVVLIPNAFVYHKRRTNLIQFYKQINFFGRARINLTRFHPGHLKILHLFPLIFIIGFICVLVLSLLNQNLGFLGLKCYLIYLSLITAEALLKLRSLKAALYTPLTTLIQMSGYAVGFIHEYIRKFRGIDPNKRYIDLY